MTSGMQQRYGTDYVRLYQEQCPLFTKTVAELVLELTDKQVVLHAVKDAGVEAAQAAVQELRITDPSVEETDPQITYLQTALEGLVEKLYELKASGLLIFYILGYPNKETPPIEDSP